MRWEVKQNQRLILLSSPFPTQKVRQKQQDETSEIILMME